MLPAIVTGVFGLIPVVVGYLSGRRRELSLLKAELEVLKEVPEDMQFREDLEQEVAWHLFLYAQRDEQRKQKWPPERRFFYAALGCYLGAAAFGVPLSIFLFTADSPMPPKNSAIVLALAIPSLVLVWSSAFFFARYRRFRQRARSNP